MPCWPAASGLTVSALATTVAVAAAAFVLLATANVIRWAAVSSLAVVIVTRSAAVTFSGKLVRSAPPRIGNGAAPGRPLPL